MDKPLSKYEQTELEKHEAIIREGLPHFFAVGSSLGIIREGRLYRVHYGSFEEYLNGRWDMTRRYANHIIEGAKVRRQLEADQRITILPQNESQIRALAKLKTKDEKVEAYIEATEMMEEETGEMRPPVTRLVEEAVQARLPKPEAKPEPKQIECSECGRWYVPPDSYWETHDQSSGRPALTEQRRVQRELESYFSKLSNLPIPAPTNERDRKAAAVRWWQPLKEIAQLASWSEREGEVLIAEAFKHLRGNGILLEAPQSIIKTVRALAAGQTASAQSGRKKSGYELYKEMYQND